LSDRRGLLRDSADPPLEPSEIDRFVRVLPEVRPYSVNKGCRDRLAFDGSKRRAFEDAVDDGFKVRRSFYSIGHWSPPYLTLAKSDASHPDHHAITLFLPDPHLCRREATRQGKPARLKG
jgi:hypothetical protein